MTDFDDLFQAGGWPVHNRQFGEPLVYYPRAGGTRSIVGIVTRNPLEPLGIEGMLSEGDEIDVENSTVTGIASSELDTGGDMIGYPTRKGTTASKRAIGKLLKDSAGRIIVKIN